ncbi:PAS domain S-box protein [Alsobacter sp. SYSU M60028]|uniref:histidine kinase n=1 Tax=Alsobacter ponti TaxID=2962936 RepID=A0ABT1L8B4_9HYPH|nr:histidine kinase dimerization/phosphoacceptor domain -containing protein [Alsobacter ponti]MCP8937258.1 PAS domain S-box protein [Alsobacter ponti]
MDSGKHFHELANAAPVLIWRAGTDRRCNWVNQSWLEFTGRSLDDELGDGWTSIIHPDDLERAQVIFAAAFEERATFARDFRLRRHDGEYRWFVDNGRPIYIADGEFGGYLGSCVDITERKEAEMRARSALEEATRALRQRDVLLAEVHHRVKNNLQVILSLLGLRSRTVGLESSRKELESIARRIQTLAFVQQELHEDRDVSRIDLKSYIERLSPSLARLHQCEHIDIRVTGRNETIEMSRAGSVGLIIAELMSNCFGHAFANGGGTVTIDVGATPDGEVAVRIQDTGPGFDPETLLDRTGIGLRLVESLARQVGIRLEWNTRHGGEVVLRIAPDGEGLTHAAAHDAHDAIASSA